MLVLKFGGTSVGSPAAIRHIIDILKDKAHADRVAAVVVSAFSGVTDGLIDMARRAVAGDLSYTDLTAALKKRHFETAAAFLKGDERRKAQAETAALIAELKGVLDGLAFLSELSPRILDLVMSFGERLSASLLAHIFSVKGINAEFLDTRPLIKTDGEFGHAQFFAEESFYNINSFFNPSKGK
jgi:aspartokinase/homoserine dehydrogenase 1